GGPVGGKRQRQDRAAMAFQLGGLTAGRLPEHRETGVVAHCVPLAVMAVSDSANVIGTRADDGLALAGGQVPEPQRNVGAAREQRLAVRRKRDGADPAGVFFEYGRFLTARRENEEGGEGEQTKHGARHREKLLTGSTVL